MWFNKKVWIILLTLQSASASQKVKTANANCIVICCSSKIIDIRPWKWHKVPQPKTTHIQVRRQLPHRCMQLLHVCLQYQRGTTSDWDVVCSLSLWNTWSFLWISFNPKPPTGTFWATFFLIKENRGKHSTCHDKSSLAYQTRNSSNWCRLLGWQTGAESNQQLGVPSQWWVSAFCKCNQNHMKWHEMTFRC